MKLFLWKMFLPEGWYFYKCCRSCYFGIHRGYWNGFYWSDRIGNVFDDKEIQVFVERIKE